MIKHMNGIVETLNHVGDQHLQFAAAMAFQVCILMVLLLVLDRVLLCRLRAAVRYSVWTLVLVRLMLPTSLSSPIALEQWMPRTLSNLLVGDHFNSSGDLLGATNLGDTEEGRLASQPTRLSDFNDRRHPGSTESYANTHTGSVSTDSSAALADIEAEILRPEPFQQASSNWKGLVLVTWLAVVTTLTFLLLRRTWLVRRIVARSSEPPDELNKLFENCLRSMRVRNQRVSLRVSPEVGSPAICGLLHATILIPSDLSAQLSEDKMRQVVVHELIHWQRHDLQVNCLQTALHIVYFYNPLVWMANTVLRRLREQAVDEAVLVTLNAAPQAYSSTLLDIAASVRRPAELTLRLVGVVESRKALAGRIKRILNQPVPKSAGLGRTGLSVVIVSGLLLLALTARHDADAANLEEAQVSESSVVESDSSSATESEAKDSHSTDDIVVSGNLSKGPGASGTNAAAGISGTGESGATVRVYSYPSWNAKPLLLHETTVDTNGRFLFSEVATLGKEARLAITATKSGFSSVIRYVTQLDGSAINLAMKSKTSNLSGTISDANGSPIADAVVTTQSFKNPVPGVHMAKSDKEGQYNIADLAPLITKDNHTTKRGKQTFSLSYSFPLVVTHPDYPLTRGKYSQIPQEVDITLHPPAIAEGQVVDLVSGEPLSNVEVQAQGVARNGWYTTKTDAEGKYQLRMTNDHYNIWAVAPERMPLAIKALKVTQGQRLIGMDIRMTQGGFVVGKVIDPATNRPIDGTQTKLHVAHYGPARPKTGAAVTSTEVKADGTYRLHVAPGRNYVYLMSGNATWVYLNIGVGETIEHDFVIGTAADGPLASDPDELLGAKIREEARLEDKKRAASQTSKPVGATLRRDTTIGNLLTELEDMNTGPDLWRDVWANQLRKIVAIGPDAIPELVAELDRTTSDRMIRCLAFILRAIDDKRAVPSLIQSIPKTLRRPGSDMGLRIDGTDETLIRFMQQHDLGKRDHENEYDFGRPVREVFGALRSLTGQEFEEEELYSVFLNDNDSPNQKHAKAVLFHRVAKQWANWWQQHGHELTDDSAFHDVKLTRPSDSIPTESLQADIELRTERGTSNWILQSIRRHPGGKVFYDLDTGRAASLPKRWRDQDVADDNLERIQEWAAKEGYDMMGDEIDGENKKPVFVLRPIGLRSWELPETRWKADFEHTSIASLKAEGRANERNLLLHYDAEKNDVDPHATATFFYVTREGTPGILYVGIEVHDDSLKPGGISTGDNELNPVAFRKGRRFGLNRLVETD